MFIFFSVTTFHGKRGPYWVNMKNTTKRKTFYTIIVIVDSWTIFLLMIFYWLIDHVIYEGENDRYNPIYV